MDLAGLSGLNTTLNVKFYLLLRIVHHVLRCILIFFSCSTTGALEAAYHQKHGQSISLSEQQLVDCAGSFNNFGCNGGLPSQAFEYIKYNGGLETEDAYPYTAKDGTCKFMAQNVALQLSDSVNITLVRLPFACSRISFRS